MKYLYKYPQSAYPYDDIVKTNRHRSRHELEYELLDTGVFNRDRYFDVFVEYAKESPEDILIKISVCNRGPETASIHVLPSLWFRNTWSWSDNAQKPLLKKARGKKDISAVEASHEVLGKRYFFCDGAVPLLFTENETNKERIFGVPKKSPYVKDGINNYIVHGNTNAVNPERVGTKVSAHYVLNFASGETKVIKLRFTDKPPSSEWGPFGSAFDDIFVIFQIAVLPSSHAEGTGKVHGNRRFFR